MIEFTSVGEAAEWAATSDRPAAAFQAIDLRGVDGFESGRFDGCLFLSCELSPAQAGFLTASGATVIRDDPRRPYATHRARLYTPDELYAGFDPTRPDGWSSTFDARVYRHWEATGGQRPEHIDESLARRIHDHSITDALDEALAGQRPVAIMGGHGLERSSPGYAMVARVARALTRDRFLMLSGGGPGAMEATHLGAWMAHFSDHELDEAIEVLSPRPGGAEPGAEYRDPDWLHRAMRVRERWPLDLPFDVPHHDSIGIPTWTYGHEPPAPFATKIAKYFANSAREEGLLAVATHGVIFSPGSAGTVQEIFQDANQNHYGTYGPPSPMVLLGREYWTERVPVWAVLEAVSDGRSYRDLIVLTDDESEAVDTIRTHHR